MTPLKRWQSATIATALLVGTCALVFASPNPGFTRDDSFYFGYSESYTNWFVAVDQAESPAEVESVLGRDSVVRTWRGNFEHPPLMKTLFGLSWRTFSRKDRPVARPRIDGGQARVRVDRLGPSTGFSRGAEVILLAPLVVGQSPTDASREIARGEVVEREGGHAVVVVSDPPKDFVATCSARAGDPGPPRLMTGCQAREDRALYVMSEAQGMRFPGIVSAGLAVMLTFLLGAAIFNWLVGLFGALAFLFIPRNFFHSQLACFDMPIVAAVLLTLYCFWRARTDRRWALAAGVAWGIALLIKHNAFIIPAPLIVYWLWTGRRTFRLSVSLRALPRVQLPRVPLAFLVMPVVAITMLFVFWPKLWYDPFRSFSEYFQFHAGHVHYMQWYFGEPLQVPPFPVEFPFALTFYTVPVAFMLLALGGILFLAPPPRWWPKLKEVWRRGKVSDNERGLAFCLLNGLFPILLIALPSVPIFGGVKHWMTAMPLWTILAGYGFYRAAMAVARLSSRPWAGRALVAFSAAIILAQPAVASIRSAPYGTGYYNSLAAGGIQGAADKLMMRMYWGHTALQALGWINDNAPKNARIFFQNTTTGSYEFYRRDGLLRDDIRYAHSPGGADIALIEPQKAFFELDIRTRAALGAAGPVYQVTYEGVPFLRVYENTKKKQRKAARE